MNKENKTKPIYINSLYKKQKQNTNNPKMSPPSSWDERLHNRNNFLFNYLDLFQNNNYSKNK